MLAFILLWSSFLANVNSLNLALGRPCGCEESDTNPLLACSDLHFLGIYANIGRTCLDTRQPGSVFKKLDPRQSDILTNFLEIARLIPLKHKIFV